VIGNIGDLTHVVLHSYMIQQLYIKQSLEFSLFCNCRSVLLLLCFICQKMRKEIYSRHLSKIVWRIQAF